MSIGRVVHISILWAFTALTATAQTGGTGSPFAFGAGSRDLALGGANISTSDFATAAFWNPARLAQSEQYGVMGFHTRLYDSDIAYQYLGIVFPTLDWGAVGFGVFRLGIDNIEKRDAGNSLLGTIDDNRMAFRLGYGRTVGSVDLGLALSLETHSLDTYKATSSPGLDLALSRRITTPFWRCEQATLSLVGRNLITPSMRLVDETIDIPFELQAGLGLQFAVSHDGHHTLNLSGSLSKPDPAEAVGAFGLEYSMFDMLNLRGGLRGDQLSFGTGLAYHGISFDYAWVDRELGALHLITLNTAFGKPVGERRQLRAERREAAFNQAMSDRLAQKNSELASQMLEAGKLAMGAGDLEAADADFDRALFLARSSGIDTTPYATLAADVRKQITDWDRAARLAAYVDSARVHLGSQDYLGCQYFAGLALGLDPGSAEAVDLRNQAVYASAELSRSQEFVQQKLTEVDSLISYGAYEQALSAAQSLDRMAPDNPAVRLSLRKAEFESFRSSAETELANRQYVASLAALDSALARFPGHGRCLELQQQCQVALKQSQMPEVAKAPVSAPLSRDLQKQVQGMYERAQHAFGRGDLHQAIAEWEEVQRLAPGYQSVREYLVKAYRFVGVDLYSRNRLTEALEIWKKALAIAPDNAEIAAYARRTQNEIDKLKELSYDN
ncbi:MAG: hypothetical protein AB1644_11995 [Candidatus Zixiibacteriota bacterium]